MDSPYAPPTVGPGMTSAPEWSQDRVATLKALWPTRNIALVLGVSRNAAVGKAHRPQPLGFTGHSMASTMLVVETRRPRQERE